jgi:very-short-patch-repair endonuclease
MSLAERRLWALLRRRQSGVRFRRQAPLGPWIADFLSFEARLVVEVTGQDPESGIDPSDDLSVLGFRVLRFSEEEVLARPDAVWRAILDALPPPTSPPPS